MLDASGRHVERPPDADGLYRSPVLDGMPLPLEWLRTRPDPAPGEIAAFFQRELDRLASA